MSKMETKMGMKIKYNRVSSITQSGNRYQLDDTKYDLVLFDKISGSVPFRDRPKAKELFNLVESGEVSELHLEEMSRIGRNTGDCISTLEWLESHKVNVVIRNLGLQSRPGGKKNPVWKMISSIMSSLYEMELENIRERTEAGRQVYLQKGGVLGRPNGSTESEKQFLDKPKTQAILKLLNRGRTIREISAITKCSSKTIQKAKETGRKYGYISCS
jgi:DNA invertase Pin-like site-specific DNA recombinase